MAATDSPLFPSDLRKDTGVAWSRPLPTSPGPSGQGQGRHLGSLWAERTPQMVRPPRAWKAQESASEVGIQSHLCHPK